jgi:hypothetical protein
MIGLFFCKSSDIDEYTIIESYLKEIFSLFTFILFLLLSGFCLLLYLYLSNQIITQRKRIILLTNENNDLRNKIRELLPASSVQNIPTPSPTDNTEKRETEF